MRIERLKDFAAGFVPSAIITSPIALENIMVWIFLCYMFGLVSIEILGTEAR